MKIAIIGSLPNEIIYFKNLLSKHEFFVAENLTEEAIADILDFEILSITIYTKIDKDIIKKLPNLKYIVTQSTGFDHINLVDCRQAGILVSNIPSYGEKSIAEFVIGLTLSLAKNIHTCHSRTQHSNFFSDDLEGQDIAGKTMGVVGLGKIGKQVAILAKAVGMNVIGNDIFEDKDFCSQHGILFTDFESLLKQADFISLHVPNCPEAFHLINQKTFAIIKSGAYLINTSRGEVIDSLDLIEALKTAKISGAAFDVFENEKELLSNNSSEAKKIHDELLKYNILHTTHIASFSIEAQNKAKQIIIDNIDSYINGQPINTL